MLRDMMDRIAEKRIVVGITGASGAAYARRLLELLSLAHVDIHLVVSPYGRRLLADELDIRELSDHALIGRPYPQLTVHPYRDAGAILGSGSFHIDGMVVCPCSSNTLASIAAGLANNLLDRAAAVTLKEMRRLILVTREMPMGRIDLLNALRATECGAIVCPAAPGFYMRPTSISDLVDFVTGKVLDLLDVPHELHTRWADQLAATTGAADLPSASRGPSPASAQDTSRAPS